LFRSLPESRLRYFLRPSSARGFSSFLQSEPVLSCRLWRSKARGASPLGAEQPCPTEDAETLEDCKGSGRSQTDTRRRSKHRKSGGNTSPVRNRRTSWVSASTSDQGTPARPARHREFREHRRPAKHGVQGTTGVQRGTGVQGTRCQPGTGVQQGTGAQQGVTGQASGGATSRTSSPSSSGPGERGFDRGTNSTRGGSGT
jgi:hypothetical protein